MKVEIRDQKYNPLLKRKEVVFEVEHERVRGTPPRFEIREKLAERLKVKLEQVYVRRLETKTGTMIALGEANAYDSVEQAMLIEPKYVIKRNTSKEKTKEAKKPEESAKEVGDAVKTEETKQLKEKEE